VALEEQAPTGSQRAFKSRPILPLSEPTLWAKSDIEAWLERCASTTSVGENVIIRLERIADVLFAVLTTNIASKGICTA
jgi:hypothetical protein